MNDDIAIIEKKLLECLPSENTLEKDVIKAMKYSLMAGGKRIRPRLTLEFARVCGGNTEYALPYACAVEMIHTYSLIHDDLPCMDNDDLRRGKPSNHIVFGQDIALLAGDALQALAFEIMCSSTNTNGTVLAVKALASACGAIGMVGGQVIDLQSENKQVSLDTIKEMYSKKTGAIIVAACQMGCYAANITEQYLIDAAASYAKAIGLAFQIEDDILDITSTNELLGKPIGSDSQNNKSTYVSIIGIEKSRQLIDQLTESALNSLQVFTGDKTALSNLAISLKNRQN